MTDIEKFIQKLCKDALVRASKEFHLGLVDMFDGRLYYDIEGNSYEIIVKKETEKIVKKETEKI
ncbi:MAG: hypothetical protein IJ794_00260 [Lachnospiraceae bacterium]|nr:hypothetical protein [Lachnospiraceae bacterium]